MPDTWTDANGQRFEMVWGRECRALPKFFSQRKLSLGGNIFFVIVFATLLQPQIYLAIKHRIPTVGILLTLGVIGEIITYVARTLQVLDPSNSHYLSIARISPLIAPIFLTFGLYQVLPRLIVVFDGDSPAATKAARWKPRTYTFLFTGWSLLTLVVYAAGLGIQVFATSGASGSVYQNAQSISLAGCILQLVSVVVFMGMCTELAVRWWLKSKQRKPNTKHAVLYNSKKFKFMIGALTLATTTIFIRTIFQVLFDSILFGPVTGYYPLSLWKDSTFMVMEGAMMAIACLALTFGHPGLGLASVWQEGNVRVKKVKVESDTVVESDGLAKQESSFESVREQVVVMSGAK